MARRKKDIDRIDDSRLMSMIRQEINKSSTESFKEISLQRINANRSFANEFTPRTDRKTKMSSVKYYFTPSFVNTLTMNMSDIFCSNKDTVEYMPMSNDEMIKKGAEQLGEMVNSVLHKTNPGFDILTELFRSAAVNKNAIVKTAWTDEMVIMGETKFEQVTQDEMKNKLLELEELNTDLEDYNAEIISKDNETEEIKVRTV